VHLFAALDPNTIGLGAVTTALVTVTGYMLANSRDSTARVDKVNDARVRDAQDERDRARASEQRAWDEVARYQRERDEVIERLNIVRYQLQVAENELARMRGQS